MDAGDALAQARFWARALDLRLVDRGDGSARLDPATGRARTEVVWIDPVPEPRIGKNRVHLDLRLAEPDPAPLVAAGARIVRTPGGHATWWVLADPEGNLFCAFPPRADTTPGVYELVVDCRDARAQAEWWAALVGGTVSADPPGAAVSGASGFPWQYWVFDPVPEPKTVKNRLHWDVDLADPEPLAFLEAGAKLLREPGGDMTWWVLADPEGNEFCAFPPGR